jgi:hypothetical protein
MRATVALVFETKSDAKNSTGIDGQGDVLERQRWAKTFAKFLLTTFGAVREFLSTNAWRHNFSNS